MSERIIDTKILLDAFDVEMKRGAFHPEKTPRRLVGWNGPGVLFVTRIKTGKSEKPLASQEVVSVVTPHAHSAGMLLDRIRKAFSPLLGPHIENDFFERIAEAVLEYSAVVSLTGDTESNLLKVILREARDILEDMENGEFPYTHSEGE